MEYNIGNHLPTNAIKVRGEFHGATNSTGGELAWYDRNSAAVTVAAGKRLYITSVQVVVSATGATAVFFDSDGSATPDTGYYLLRGTLAANGILQMNFEDPVVGPAITAAGIGHLQVTCASGDVNCIATGYIV